MCIDSRTTRLPTSLRSTAIHFVRIDTNRTIGKRTEVVARNICKKTSVRSIDANVNLCTHVSGVTRHQFIHDAICLSRYFSNRLYCDVMLNIICGKNRLHCSLQANCFLKCISNIVSIRSHRGEHAIEIRSAKGER